MNVNAGTAWLTERLFTGGYHGTHVIHVTVLCSTWTMVQLHYSEWQLEDLKQAPTLKRCILKKQPSLDK